MSKNRRPNLNKSWLKRPLNETFLERIKPHARTCAEMHPHDPDCVSYDSELVEELDRMKWEITRLRSHLASITHHAGRIDNDVFEEAKEEEDEGAKCE